MSVVQGGELTVDQISKAWVDVGTRRKLFKLLYKLGVQHAKKRAGINVMFNKHNVKVPGVYYTTKVELK